MSVRDQILDLKNRVQQDIIGQEEIVERLLIGLLANGNLLVEGLPGLAKTRTIMALSKNIEGSFGRIQFTPDLVGTDITGRQVYHEAEAGGEGHSEFIKGPIFNNIVLADEINRAPSKSQNSLLEAMEERQVTVGGETHKMPELFLVMATQNPVDQDGTYPLPEAQKDRFLLHVTVDYPDEEAEGNIIRLVRGEESQKEKQKNKQGNAQKNAPILTSQQVIFDARKEIDTIPVPKYVEEYMVNLIFATRYPQRYTYELKSYIAEGVSPRASIGLDKVCRVHAWINGQSEVGIENVHAMIKSVLRHRIIRGHRAIDHKITTDDIVDEILELVEVPNAPVTGETSASTKE